MGVHEGVGRAMSGAKLSECRSPGEARQRSSVPKLRKCQRLFIEKGEPAEAAAAVAFEYVEWKSHFASEV